jgi:hypothetical protein
MAAPPPCLPPLLALVTRRQCWVWLRGDSRMSGVPWNVHELQPWWNFMGLSITVTAVVVCRTCVVTCGVQLYKEFWTWYEIISGAMVFWNIFCRLIWTEHYVLVQVILNWTEHCAMILNWIEIDWTWYWTEQKLWNLTLCMQKVYNELNWTLSKIRHNIIWAIACIILVYLLAFTTWAFLACSLHLLAFLSSCTSPSTWYHWEDVY